MEAPLLNLRRVTHLLAGMADSVTDALAKDEKPDKYEVENLQFLADEAMARAIALEALFYEAFNAAAPRPKISAA